MNEQTAHNNSIIQQERIIQSHFNYDDIIQWIEKKGIELYGNHFRIIENDYSVIYRLIAYFLKDQETAYRYNLDLDKGIILSGPVGCGKTSLLNIMKHLTPAGHKFSVKPCRDISFEFIKDGYEVIHRYANGKLYISEPKIYCFDDLGVENNLKYYGNECNVMAEVLLSRYDIFIAKRIPTHITTNLSASEIEQHYGVRVRSRLRQMMNLIAYEKNTSDKR
ncbi:ATPase [Flavobacterium wongokense]|uniref:ATPase n=1 Tax=Flavobacterium wongokense TaxID=2910674 RepID=UPI001F19A8F6|nr:ATPase [Flavobacterium sp. WG47]MCF6132756.1 ATPase [Flavobacterium sp. WG47]